MILQKVVLVLCSQLFEQPPSLVGPTPGYFLGGGGVLFGGKWKGGPAGII